MANSIPSLSRWDCFVAAKLGAVVLESIVASSSSAKLASLKMARNFFHLSLSFVKNPPLFPSRFYTQPSSRQQLQWLAKLVLLESVATIKMEPRQSHALCSSLNYAVPFTIRFERREGKGWMGRCFSRKDTRCLCHMRAAEGETKAGHAEWRKSPRIEDTRTIPL